MKVFVIGKEGQLARALQERGACRPGMDILAFGRPHVDLEVPGSVGSAISSVAPDAVINAAAYTAVDQAEDEPERAFRINADAAGEAAAAALAIKARMVQISTDYVFDGSADCAYREDAPTNPLGVYGRSKLQGEEQVRAAKGEHLIVRTAWVYSPWGRNFVKMMLRLSGERNEVGVVDDQYGSPTSATELADALLTIMERWHDGVIPTRNTYHIVGKGRCSWADLADETFRVSAAHGGPSAAVRRITTGEFPTKASRPRNSTLATMAFEEEFGFDLCNWQNSLENVVRQLVGN